MIDLKHVDRACDNRTDDLFWNESVWFSYSIPERGIHGFFYYFCRPNMNLVCGGPAMWDGSGNCSWNCLYFDWHHLQKMPADWQKFNATLPNSHSVKVVKPAKEYLLHYDKNGFQLDLEWTAIGEPHDFTAMEEVASGATGQRLHLEQCGRVKGTIRHHGETYAVDCYSLRDTSFGTRDFSEVQRGSYFWGIASPETAFHVLTIGGDVEQKVAGGFMILDGKTATLTGGTRRVTEAGPYTPAAFTLDMEDKLGRTLSINARISSDFIFTGYPDCLTIWSLLEWEHNGQKVWGDIQEFMPPEQFRAKARSAA